MRSEWPVSRGVWRKQWASSSEAVIDGCGLATSQFQVVGVPLWGDGLRPLRAERSGHPQDARVTVEDSLLVRSVGRSSRGVGGRSRLNTLTGLRALAALAVFAVHMQARLSGDPAHAFAYISNAGGMGVTFFFALSGFILTWSYRSGDTAAPFWRRRFARIYPAYLVALLGGVLLTVASHGRDGVSAVQSYDRLRDLVGPFLAQLTLTQSWVPDEKYYFSLNGVGWSLSCEAFFYACFPALIVALVHASTRVRRLVQAGSFAVLVAAALAVELDAFPHAGWLQGHAPILTAFQFVLGITVALDVRDGKWSRLNFRWTLLVVAAMYVMCCIWPSTFSMSAVPVLPFLALIAAGCWRDQRNEGGLLSGRVFVWLGEVSFCFYLVHQMVIRCLGVLGGAASWNGAVVQTLVALTLSLLAAWLLHVLVEKPFERRLRGTNRAKPPQTVQAG
nr:acyltransferase [Modestobacter excelsi]